MKMADIGIKSKHDEEVESLAMNLRRNKLASSDSEARRMAQEMLSTGKKVQDDFVAREKKIYGTQVKNPEVELAHRQVEQLTSNLSQGKSNVRIDIPELDLNKPLKDIVGEDDDYSEKEDDEIIEMKEDSASEPAEESPGEEQAESVDELSEEVAEEPIEEAGEQEQESEQDEKAEEVSEDNKEVEEPAEEPAEPSEEEPKADEDAAADDEDDDSGDIGPGDAPNQPVEVEKTADDGDEDDGGDGDDDSGEGGDDDKSDGEPDFSVKELDGSEQLKKSEDDRKAEISRMEESRINLTNVFNVHK
jgi:hypothetical protein